MKYILETMSEVLEEVKVWNTPIIGACLLWRFTSGYTSNHPNGDGPTGLLHFIATAILTNQRLSTPISNKRADLQSYVRSFEETKSSDLLLSIHERVKDKMSYTMKALSADGTVKIIVFISNRRLFCLS